MIFFISCLIKYILISDVILNKEIENLYDYIDVSKIKSKNKTDYKPINIKYLKNFIESNDTKKDNNFKKVIDYVYYNKEGYDIIKNILKGRSIIDYKILYFVKWITYL